MDNLLDKRKLLEQELVRYSVLKGNIDNFILDINNNLNEINDEIFKKCDHKWEYGCEQGIYEPRERICKLCNSVI